MSFIVAGLALLLALLVGVVLDHTDVGKSREAPSRIPSFDAWSHGAHDPGEDQPIDRAQIEAVQPALVDEGGYAAVLRLISAHAGHP